MLELLKKRRSIRKYKNRKVDSDKIENLVRAALLSPSSRWTRPWEFIVVTDRELLAALSRAKQSGSGFLKGAPLGIVVAADPGKCDVWVEDTSIASIIIQLAAESMGLSSCWIQIRERIHEDGQPAEQYIRNLLNIPDNLKVECIIGVGYGDEQKPPYRDEELLYDKVHFNRFGQQDK